MKSAMAAKSPLKLRPTRLIRYSGVGEKLVTGTAAEPLEDSPGLLLPMGGDVRPVEIF